MPTIFTHPAVPLAIGLGLGQRIVPMRLLVCGAIGAVLPDLDFVAYKLGIPSVTELSHRGPSHSLLFAFALALLVACCCRWLRAGFFITMLFMFVAVSSHGLLDTFTNGGRGIALLWPWSDHRYFAPIHFIEVSPLRLDRFFSARGIVVLKSELFRVWLPAVTASLLLISARMAFLRKAKPSLERN